MKKFSQSPYKFALDGLIIFLVVAFFVFFISYTQVDNIRYVTVYEALAALGIGLSLAVIYIVIYHSAKRQRYVYVDRQSLIIDRLGKQQIIDFSEINSLDIFSGRLYKLIHAVKLRVESQKYFYTFFISASALTEFLELMPTSVSSKSCMQRPADRPGVDFVAELLRSTFIFVLGWAFVLPGIFSMVRAADRHYIWFSLLSSYIFLVFVLVIFYVAKRLIYQNLNYNIDGDSLSVCSGRFMKRSYTISKDSITAVILSHNFFSKLFNLYRIKFFTKGGGKGITENVYFPFMLKKENAFEILRHLTGEELIDVVYEKPKLITIIPTVVLWLIPSVGIEALGMLGSSLLRLLYIPVALFILVTFLNNRRALTDNYFIQQKGFINRASYFIPKDKIERLDAFQTVTCQLLKMTYIEIYLSGYRAVIFGGYYFLSDYDKLLKNINKLS